MVTESENKLVLAESSTQTESAIECLTGTGYILLGLGVGG